MIRKTSLFKPRNLSFLKTSLKHTFFTSYRTRKDYEHCPLYHPVDLKTYSASQFQQHHKKVYKQIFGEEMPEDHLQNPEFTVFEINKTRRLFWEYYYQYYLLTAGLVCSAAALYYYSANQTTGKLKINMFN